MSKIPIFLQIPMNLEIFSKRFSVAKVTVFSIIPRYNVHIVLRDSEV